MKMLIKCLALVTTRLHSLLGYVAIPNTIAATRYPEGVKSLATEAAVARHQVVKFGSSETACDVCTTAAIPLGTCRGAADSGDNAAVFLFGAAPGTFIGIADAAIAKDALLTPGSTAGRLRTLPTGAGTYYVCGRAITAAANAADEFEFVSCCPYKIVIP